MSKRKRQRRNTKSYSRKQKTRELRKRFLIVCEGAKTEPNYFAGFKVPLEIKGTGYNTINLVQETIGLSKQGRFDQVWVVLDKDDFPTANFNTALDLAKQEGINVAYSNEAFELWYLLHFDFHQSAISRATYQSRLSQKQRLNFKYQKNNPQIHEVLRPKIDIAIRNADRLLQLYGSNHSPARDNPSTSVHLLVQELLKNEA